MADKKPPGRKPKLTDELMGQFESALQGHSTVAAACDMLGVDPSSFYKWMAAGETATGGIKREFFDTVKRAKGMSRVMLINKISQDPSWQAKAWLLERMYPQEFGRRQLIAHAGPDGETPLQPGAGSAVRLNITMQTPEGGVMPWTFSPDDQDDDGQESGDQWGKDVTDWEAPPQPPLSASAIVEAIKKQRPNGPAARGPQPNLDTGGRPKDPDA